MDNYLPFLIFVLAMAGTPGPGNLALAAMGQAGGFRSAMPFLAGAVISFTILNLMVALGLGRFYAANPLVAPCLKVCGMIYIIHLAVKLLRLQLDYRLAGQRLTFAEGLYVHPLSPKSWAMSVAGFSQFVRPDNNEALTIAAFVLTFFAGQVLFHSLWCAAGASISSAARSGTARKAAGFALSGLMVSATVWAFFA